MNLQLTLNRVPYTLKELSQYDFHPSFINELWKETLHYAEGGYLDFFKPILGEAIITAGALFYTTSYHLICQLKDASLPQDDLTSWDFKIKLFKSDSDYHTLTPSFPVTNEGLTAALRFAKKVIQTDLQLEQKTIQTRKLDYLQLFKEAQDTSDLTPILVELALAHSVKHTIRHRELDPSLITAVLSLIPNN